ncbi:MAG: SagB/ThcOx family dehydrogenase [Anaerolineae bacterium]|nr:SagB/ThcOx family dehydrogenase [Anaerolineae bacterium]
MREISIGIGSLADRRPPLRAWWRLWMLAILLAGCGGARATAQLEGETIDLPAPRTTGPISLEETLSKRRSVRTYTAEQLTMEQIGQLLWAAQGVTRDWGARTSPSAGALYPLEVYAVTREGLYHYLPSGHRARYTPALDLHDALWEAGLKQDPIREAPAVFCIAAVYARTSGKYGERAVRYVHLEAGHAAENLLLQAVALDLGAVVIGAFHDDQVQSALGLPDDHAPLYLIPVGHPAE